MPITLCTWGRRTALIAGELADEIKVGGSANPFMVGVLKPVLAEGSRLAGRCDDAVGICLGAVTVIDADRTVARELARREVAVYLPVVAGLDPSTDPEWLACIETASAEHNLDAVTRNLSDDILDRFAFAGDADDLIRQVAALEQAGATRVEFGTPLGANPLAAVRLLGEKVLPAFR
jgi:5,10-methylenetetrahydromethanopterin reductase